VLLLPTAATLFAIRELSGLMTMLVEVHREHMGRVLGEPAFHMSCELDANANACATERAPRISHLPARFGPCLCTPERFSTIPASTSNVMRPLSAAWVVSNSAEALNLVEKLAGNSTELIMVIVV